MLWEAIVAAVVAVIGWFVYKTGRRAGEKEAKTEAAEEILEREKEDAEEDYKEAMDGSRDDRVNASLELIRDRLASGQYDGGGRS